MIQSRYYIQDCLTGMFLYHMESLPEKARFFSKNDLAWMPGYVYDPDCFSANEAFELVRVYPELRLIRVSTPANAND